MAETQTTDTQLAPLNTKLAAAADVRRNTEDNNAGVIKYGVADYEPRKSAAKITAPTRPALLAPPEPPQDGSPLLLMM